MIGSAKKPKPMKNVVIFMNMSEVVKAATATPGTRRPANLIRALSFGKGAVGDSALPLG